MTTSPAAQAARQDGALFPERMYAAAAGACAVDLFSVCLISANYRHGHLKIRFGLAAMSRFARLFSNGAPKRGATSFETAKIVFCKSRGLLPYLEKFFARFDQNDLTESGRSRFTVLCLPLSPL